MEYKIIGMRKRQGRTSGDSIFGAKLNFKVKALKKGTISICANFGIASDRAKTIFLSGRVILAKISTGYVVIDDKDGIKLTNGGGSKSTRDYACFKNINIDDTPLSLYEAKKLGSIALQETKSEDRMCFFNI